MLFANSKDACYNEKNNIVSQYIKLEELLVRKILIVFSIIFCLFLFGCANDNIQPQVQDSDGGNLNGEDETSETSDSGINEIISPEDKKIDDWVLENFDVNDEKIIWQGDENVEFTLDKIIVVLKKTMTYPELDISVFGLKNAISMEYLSDVTPPAYFFKPEYQDLLNNFRQIIVIHIEPSDKVWSNVFHEV